MGVERKGACLWCWLHAHQLYASLCEQTKARVLAGGAAGGGAFPLAEEKHKWNVQGKYQLRFCKARMALLQHLSQQLPNGAFGSAETRGSWSQVWSQRFGLRARGGWTSPRGGWTNSWGARGQAAGHGAVGHCPLVLAEQLCWRAGLLPALIRTEIQPS